MSAHRRWSHTRFVIWFFACLLLMQPMIAPSGLNAQETVDQYSKRNYPWVPTAQSFVLAQRGGADSSVLPAWERLKDSSLGELKIFWQPQIGTPKAIYGLMANVSARLNNPESAARYFLTQHAALFKLNSMADLQLIKLSQEAFGIHIFFQQVYQGLPVYGGQMGVHINRRGRIHAVVSSYTPVVRLASTKPRVSSETVLERMLTELGSEAGHSLMAEPRRALVVYVAQDGAHLAWQMTIPTQEPLGTWEACWDALTGVRISPMVDRNYYVDGTGKVFVPNAVVATGTNNLTDQNDSSSAVPGSAYTTVTLLGLDGSGFLTGPYVNTSPTANRVNRSNNDFTDLNRQGDGFEEVETYWSIDDAQRYIQSFSILNAANYSIGVDAHGTPADNSFYSGFGNGRGEITMGDGGVDDAEDAEILWHEYGHAILDNQVPNINQNFEGMGEGFGDYWAATMSTRHASANHAQYDPAVGEWDATSYNPGNPPYLRRVDTDAHYPEDKHPDPHVTGMIWSGALWDIHNDIGRDTADEIFLQGNFLMSMRPTLPEAAQAMLTADQNINGGANNAALTDAFIARGLITQTPPEITVLSPNGGESWTVGNVRNILWNSQSVTGNVKIELSRDGGTTYEIIAASTTNDGVEGITVTGPASTQCRARVSAVNDASGNDVSDNNFTINDAPPPPPGSICPAKTAVQGTPEAAGTLELLYRFRDEVLAMSPRGQQYARLYYQVSGEAVSVMVSNPDLLFQARDMLNRFAPVIQAMVDRRGVRVTQADLAAVDRFLTVYAAQSSPVLRQKIEQLKRELQDRQAQLEFGITVAP